MTVSEIIEDVRDRICNEICKYPYIWNEEKEGKDLSESEHCKNCPLNEL